MAPGRSGAGRLPAEAALHRLWGERRLYGNAVRTQDGGVLRVVFPGWPNLDRGPDFKSAVLRDGTGALLTGDVELHRRQGDWYRHGHDADPEYAGVILHVVWSGDPKLETRSRRGGRIPVGGHRDVLGGAIAEDGRGRRAPPLRPPPRAAHRGQHRLRFWTPRGDRRLGALRRLLAASDEGYWSRHWDFCRPGPASATLLGPSRAAELTVNVVLPFFLALSRLRGGQGGRRSLPLALPRAPVPRREPDDGGEMERMLLPEGARAVVTTARRQQGLIGPYEARCCGLVCAGCGVAAAVTGDVALREMPGDYWVRSDGRVRSGERDRRWERRRRSWCRLSGSRST